MAEISLTATTGREVGTRSSRRLRAQGRIPGVVYGLGRDPVAVSVAWTELRPALITDAGLNVLLDLTVEGEGEAQLAIIKDMQRHPIRQTVEHLDFLLIRRDQEITVEVPLLFEGEAKKVDAEQGMIEHLLQSLTVKSKPGAIPDQIIFDISNLAVGDTVTVSDLALPDGVTTDLPGDEAVATVSASRAALETTDEADDAAALADGADSAGAGDES